MIHFIKFGSIYRMSGKTVAFKDLNNVYLPCVAAELPIALVAAPNQAVPRKKERKKRGHSRMALN